MAKVSIRNVSKAFRTAAGREVHALNELNLEVPNGEFLVLAGPSGCGKSTLLRTIAGLDTLTAGDVFIGDKRVNDVPPKDRDVALVFQSHALFPHLNAHDNIAFGLKLRGRPAREIKTRVDEAAAILDIGSLLTRKPAELSGGERQRVALGRAIVRQPRVFLLDEPLSHLDAKTRAQTRAELSRLHARLQTTMIYVTHDQVEAMSMGTRLAIMEGGAIRQAAPPVALYQEPDDLFVAGFLGSPPMNLIRGKLTAGGDALVFKEDGGVVECRFPASERPALKSFAGKDVVLGVRPEDITRQEGGLPARARERAENTFQCLVDLIEPTGGETNLHLQTGKGSIVCRVHGIVDGRETGHRAGFQVNVARAHFFDPQTTRRIRG